MQKLERLDGSNTMAVMQYYTKYIPEKLSSVQKVTSKLTSVPFRAVETVKVWFDHQDKPYSLQ
jgi:hypothetical protein